MFPEDPGCQTQNSCKCDSCLLQRRRRKTKSIQMMSGKHFKAHEVSCCIKYFIFGFNIIFWVSPPSAVCDFRPAIVSLTRWHALCSQSAAVRCIYVCVCVCCCVYVVLGFDSLPLSLLLLCTCSLSPISPLCFRVSSIRVRTALSLGIIACLHDRSFQLRPFFLLFFCGDV